MLTLCIFWTLLLAPRAAAHERDDWAPLFNEAGVAGTLVVHDTRDGKRWVANRERSTRRLSPASTFKIPHTLFALQAKKAHEFETFKWDGKTRWIKSWNQDQTLHAAMRNSTVWVYEILARRIGAQQELAFLKAADYGNASIEGELGRFWIDGGLKISAVEHVRFLERLYQNTLPFDVAHQRLVKDLILVEAGRDWRLRAKTGWSGQVGWWVGWVERTDGVIFFALNMDMTEVAQAGLRKSITRAALCRIKALPSCGSAYLTP